MRVVEFRIPLPLGMNEYAVAQLYNVAKKSLEDQVKAVTNKSPDGIQYLRNEPFENELGSKGQYSEKRMTILGKFPKWITSLVDAEYFTMLEDSWNSFPTFKTKYRSNVVKNFIIEFHTNHAPGIKPPKGRRVQSLDPELDRKIEVVNLDIVSDSPTCPEFDLTTLKSGRKGWKGFARNWMKSPNYETITAYKIFVIDLPLLPSLVRGRVEDFVVGAVKNELLNFHRRIIYTVDEWSGFDIDRIRTLEGHCTIWLQNVAGVQSLIGKGSVDTIEPPESRDAAEYRISVKKLLNGNHVSVLDEFERIRLELNPYVEYTPIKSPLKNDDEQSISLKEPRNMLEWTSMAVSFLGANRWRNSELKKIHRYFDPDGNNNGRGPSKSPSTQDENIHSDSSPISRLLQNKKRPTSIWKLSEGWMGSSWSKRQFRLEGSQLSYYGNIAPASDEEPKSQISLIGCKIRYSSDEDELGGRSHGIIISQSTWSRPLIISCDNQTETKAFTVELQVLSSKLSSRKSTNTLIVPKTPATNTPASTPRMLDDECDIRYPMDQIRKIAADENMLISLNYLLTLSNASQSEDDVLDPIRRVDILLDSPFCPQINHDWTNCDGLYLTSSWKHVPILNDAKFNNLSYRCVLKRFWKSEPVITKILFILLNFALFAQLLLGFLLSRYGLVMLACFTMVEYLFIDIFKAQLNGGGFIPNERNKQDWWRSGIVSGILIPTVFGIPSVKTLPNNSSITPMSAIIKTYDCEIDLNTIINKALKFLPSDRLDGEKQRESLRKIDCLKSRGLCGNGLSPLSHAITDQSINSSIINTITLGNAAWIAYALDFEDSLPSKIAWISRKSNRHNWQVSYLGSPRNSFPNDTLISSLQNWLPLREAVGLADILSIDESSEV